MAGAGGFGQDPSQMIKDQVTPEVAKAATSAQDEAGPAVPLGGGGDQGAGGTPGAAEVQGKTKDASLELGAGGTSEKVDPEDGEPVLPGGSGGGKAAAATAAAAPAAAQVAVIMMFINWLKSMFAMVLAALANLWAMFVGMIMAVAKAVVGFFVGIGSGIASAVGGAVSAVTGAVMSGISFLLGGVLAVGAIVGVVQSDDISKHDALPVACEVAVQQAVNASDGTIDVSAQTLANAKTVYSVLAAWGMSDENVAGILGNWSKESGIDPTSVEGIYVEPFHIGANKQAAQDENFAGFTNHLGNTMDVRGLGLGQWTNGRGQALLDYASSQGLDWFALETQLGFMLSPSEGSNAEIVKGMISTPQDGPETAAVYFHDEWERSADTSLEARKEAASSWYAQMGGWATNQTLADSILAQSGTAIDGADKAAVNAALSECVGSRLNVDNSSLATAMTSYAWPMYDDSKGNDGTYLYVWLHEEIFPGDPYFASCDRSVATGVRWSGSDDTFPMGAVQEQLNYVGTSDKWENLDWGGNKANLQPGDILIRKDSAVSHIVMYVGPDVPLQVWGEGNFTTNAEIASGSLNDRSPALGQWYGASSGHGTVSSGGTGLDTYTAWRLKSPEASSKYVTLVPPDSATMGDGDKTSLTTPGRG